MKIESTVELDTSNVVCSPVKDMPLGQSFFRDSGGGEVYIKVSETETAVCVYSANEGLETLDYSMFGGDFQLVTITKLHYKFVEED